MPRIWNPSGPSALTRCCCTQPCGVSRRRMSRNRTETVAKYLPKKASACSRESVASLKLYQMVKSGDKMASNPDIFAPRIAVANRSEEHTSELQLLMRISYAAFRLTNKQVII